MFGVTLVVDGCYWFGALQGPLHCKSNSALTQTCLTSKEQSNPGLGPSHGKELVRGYFGRGWLLLVWSSARATSLQKQSALTQTCLARTPGWGQVTGKNLFGVTLVVDGCYWFGALQAPLHCKSSSALTQTCLTSKEQSNPGLGPSHGKELVRGYFGRGWLLLSRDLAPIRGYFVPYLSSKSESRQNCFCSEVALAELQTSSSHPRPK